MRASTWALLRELPARSSSPSSVWGPSKWRWKSAPRSLERLMGRRTLALAGGRAHGASALAGPLAHQLVLVLLGVGGPFVVVRDVAATMLGVPVPAHVSFDE